MFQTVYFGKTPKGRKVYTWGLARNYAKLDIDHFINNEEGYFLYTHQRDNGFLYFVFPNNQRKLLCEFSC